MLFEINKVIWFIVLVVIGFIAGQLAVKFFKKK